MASSHERRAKELLEEAGVALNGPAPTDIQVHNPDTFRRVFAYGTLGLGESYMDGWWDAKDLAGFFTKVLRAELEESLKTLSTLWYFIQARFTNMQSWRRAFEVGEAHYDLGNDLFEAMLGRTMVYTCGYWSSPTAPARTLEEAQEAKLDLICRKIGLKSGQTVLDIGCGWGSFLKFAAEKYGAKGVGITVSKEQAELARERCRGLPVEIRVEDYRDTAGTFDHVVSIGMFEHVGPKNYRAYMQKVHSLLKDGGVFLLHTIGWPVTSLVADPWIDKYIFPNGVLPSAAQISNSFDRLFIMEDWHNFGADYDKTLVAWFNNFDLAWPALKDTYGERFYRMWKFYLLSCAALFRARRTQLWQIVLTKKGVPGGYQTVR